MIERLYIPPHYPDIHDNKPSVFLAGPVQGASDWQTPLARQLLGARDDIVVMSPRRTEDDQKKFDADEQKLWEFTTRDYTRQLGVTAFWWAAQAPSIPYKTGRAYAQTSRIELGEAIGWRTYDMSIPVVVGFDQNYEKMGGGSESYIRSLCRDRGIIVVDTAEDLESEILQEVEKLCES